MGLDRKWTVGYAAELVVGVGLVFAAIGYILSADTRIIWPLVTQFPYGILLVGAGLFLYGEAVWQLARRDRTAASRTGDAK